MAVEGEPPSGNDVNPMAVLHRVASGNTNPPVRSGPMTATLLSMMAQTPGERPDMVDVANRLTDVGLGRIGGSDQATKALRTQPPLPGGAAGRPDGRAVPPELSPRPAKPSPRTMALEPSLRSPPPPMSGPPPLFPMSSGPDEPRSRSLWPVLVAAVLVIGLASSSVSSCSAATTTPRRRRTARACRRVRRPHRTARPSRRRVRRRHPSPSSSDRDAHLRRITRRRRPNSSRRSTDYYDLVPANLDAGWGRLSRHFQTTKAQSRGVYDSYWGSVSRVDVSAARAEPPRSAIATLVYHYKNGQVTTRAHDVHVRAPIRDAEDLRDRGARVIRSRRLGSRA